MLVQMSAMARYNLSNIKCEPAGSLNVEVSHLSPEEQLTQGCTKKTSNGGKLRILHLPLAEEQDSCK
jgi:hypothetical protein